MFKRLFRSPRFVSFAGALTASYIRFVYRTSRITIEPSDFIHYARASDPQIISTWHGQFLLAPMLQPKWCHEAVAMVARHGDAEFIAQTLKRFGTGLVRGAGAGSRSRDRGGASALRGAIRALKRKATVIITADIPPGPARRASLGVVTLARLSGRPVTPFAVATSHFFALGNWSALTINLPFSKLAIVFGEPLWVPSDASPEELEAMRVEFERRLNATIARAYAIAGSDDPLSEAYRARANRPGLLIGAYRALTWLGKPLVPLLLSWRTRRGKEDPAHRSERYGIATVPRPEGFLCWLHAASVGETNAALPLIEAICKRWPQVRILLTTGTVTSAKLARERLPDGAIHQYVPLDGQDHVRRFLAHWRPNLGLLMESEIWPNLLLEAHRQEVPLVLINGRMSDRSYRRWRRLKGLSRPLFSSFDLVLAQNTHLARNFARLGAPKALAVGNLKADAPAPPSDLTGKAELAAALEGRTVFLAASTHAGEEEAIAAAHISIRKTVPDLLTIIVPRHPERGPTLAKALETATLKTALRSQGALPGPETDIYIADTIGELGMFYALAPVAFIGGSLVQHGGQNPVEAIKLGAAVLTGPSWWNFADSYSQLIKAGGCHQVEDATGLAKQAVSLLRHDDEREAMMAKADAALAKMGGALARTLTELTPFFPPHDGELQ